MIEVKGLSKKFDARGIAGLHDISFVLDSGKILGLMGPNGSGKTTLLKILMGHLPSTGVASANGSVRLFPTEGHFQDINVQKFLVQEIQLDIDEEKKIQLTRDIADTFEFTFQLRQRLSELSAGQKQKVLLARDLLNRPGILLLDEPFTHLDPFTRKDILSNLFHYIRHVGITVLWVTHDLEEALKFSDFVGVMNFGKLVQIDHPEKLLQEPKSLFVAQFMGYQNFFPVKLQNEFWQTPWGQWSKSFSGDEAIMVIPDESWVMTTNLGMEFTVTERYGSKQGIEYQLQSENRMITLKKATQVESFSIGEKLHLTPRWEECFLIPL